MPHTSIVTISRFLIDQERTFPAATGAFTSILHDIAVAAKMISREVNMAGLVDILGRTGDEDVIARDLVREAGRIAGRAERDGVTA